VRWNKIPSPENLGDFELLLDEDLAMMHDQQQSQSSFGRSTYGSSAAAGGGIGMGAEK
jgi:hypothetical protein